MTSADSVPIPRITSQCKSGTLGHSTDESLERAIDFLEQLAFSRAQDVRPYDQGTTGIYKKRYASLFPDSFDKAQEEAFERARQDSRPRSSKGAPQIGSSTCIFGVSPPRLPPSHPRILRIRRRSYQRCWQDARSTDTSKNLMQKQLEVQSPEGKGLLQGAQDESMGSSLVEEDLRNRCKE